MRLVLAHGLPAGEMQACSFVRQVWPAMLSNTSNPAANRMACGRARPLTPVHRPAPCPTHRPQARHTLTMCLSPSLLTGLRYRCALQLIHQQQRPVAVHCQQQTRLVEHSKFVYEELKQSCSSPEELLAACTQPRKSRLLLTAAEIDPELLSASVIQDVLLQKRVTSQHTSWPGFDAFAQLVASHLGSLKPSAVLAALFCFQNAPPPGATEAALELLAYGRCLSFEEKLVLLELFSFRPDLNSQTSAQRVLDVVAAELLQPHSEQVKMQLVFNLSHAGLYPSTDLLQAVLRLADTSALLFSVRDNAGPPCRL